MQGNHFVHHIHVTGTLAANVTDIFALPADCQLEHISAVGTNASNAQIKAGTTSSDAAYLALADVGDSSVPAEFDRDNFVGGEYPHLVKGTLVQVTVDFDGAGGTAVQNLTVTLTFAEG
jgi:hypothetical protein